MDRVFVFAHQPCYGETGGGQGVVYRLYQANRKYKLWNNVYFVFGDRVIYNGEEIGELAEKKEIKKSKVKSKLVKNIPGKFKVIQYEKKYKKLKKYLLEIGMEYHFTDSDTYIFHDLQFARAFAEIYAYDKSIMVIHAQGSFYNEWVAIHGYECKDIKKYYEKCFVQVINKFKFIGFPSEGAKNCFYESALELRKYEKECEYKILYNGVVCPKVKPEHYIDFVKKLKESNGYIFATIATLNSAKAVERIPQFLGRIKKEGIKFKWVLVGKGVKEENVLAEIINAEIKEETVWLNKYVSHEEVLQILSIADFYILFHKYSIFDLSTLEAMHYGAIPILTPVGGNLEVIKNENGIFIDDFQDIQKFVALIENDLEPIHKLNQKIQQENFNDEAFLKYYVELCTNI